MTFHPLMAITPSKTLGGFGYFCIVLCFSYVFSAYGNEKDSFIPPPKICVVLSGGGALGVAHVGVLKFLEEQKIPIHCITGTSMGSIIGGLYASGYTAEELEQLVRSTNWMEIFEDEAPRSEKSYQRKLDDLNFLVKYHFRLNDEGKVQFPKGFILGNKIDFSFMEFTLRSNHIKYFDDLPIPFRTVAVDLENGEQVILSSGSLAKAMKASMSIPGVFLPTEHNERLLIDGGVMNNLPIDIAREMGAEIIIAADVQSELKTKDELRSALDIAAQVTRLMIKQNKDLQIKTLNEADVLISPDVRGYTPASFDKTNELIEPGYEAAKLQLESLKRYAIGGAEYAKLRETQVATQPDLGEIAFIKIDNQSGVNDQQIIGHMRTKVGQTFDIASLKQDLITLNGLGYFDNVQFEVAQQDDKHGVIVTAHGPGAQRLLAFNKKPYKSDDGSSPNSLQFGIALEDDFNGDSEYSIGLRYKRIPVNAYGGELIVDLQIGERARALASFFQPLDQEARYFVQPVFGYQARDIPVFESDIQIANVRLHEGLAGIDVGRQFSNVAELRAGFRRGVLYADVVSGALDLELGNFQTATYFVNFAYDSFDNINFPKSGAAMTSRFTSSLDELGADEAFQTFEFDLGVAKTWGSNTVLLSTSANLNLLSEDSIQGQFTLGGFGIASGYKREGLIANNFLFHQAVYYHQWSPGYDNIFSVPLYAGISLEAVSLFDDKDDASLNPDDYFYAGAVFLGAETVFGPVFLGYGMAEDDNHSVYLYIGRSF